MIRKFVAFFFVVIFGITAHAAPDVYDVQHFCPRFPAEKAVFTQSGWMVSAKAKVIGHLRPNWKQDVVAECGVENGFHFVNFRVPGALTSREGQLSGLKLANVQALAAIAYIIQFD